VRTSKTKSFKVNIRNCKSPINILSKYSEHKQGNIPNGTARKLEKCSCNVMLRLTQVDEVSRRRYPHILRALVHSVQEKLKYLVASSWNRTHPC